jgi:hypothetical protein
MLCLLLLAALAFAANVAAAPITVYRKGNASVAVNKL